MDYYDDNYRRQYCRDRIARAHEEYRRAQAPPSDSRQQHAPIAWISSIWQRARHQPAHRSPAYKA